MTSKQKTIKLRELIEANGLDGVIDMLAKQCEEEADRARRSAQAIEALSPGPIKPDDLDRQQVRENRYRSFKDQLQNIAGQIQNLERKPS